MGYFLLLLYFLWKLARNPKSFNCCLNWCYVLVSSFHSSDTNNLIWWKENRISIYLVNHKLKGPCSSFWESYLKKDYGTIKSRCGITNVIGFLWTNFLIFKILYFSFQVYMLWEKKIRVLEWVLNLFWEYFSTFWKYSQTLNISQAFWKYSGTVSWFSQSLPFQIETALCKKNLQSSRCTWG